MLRAFRSIALFFVCVIFSCFANAQVFVTATGGNPAAFYPTIKSAFDAVNIAIHTGDVHISITSNTMEPVTATLHASGFGPARYTSVIIQPAAGVSPVISGAANPMIRLEGSFITIDGSNNGSNSRNLTFINSHSTSTSCLEVSGSNFLSGVTIMNTNVTNKSSGACIEVTGSVPGSGCFFDGLVIRNNELRYAQKGIDVMGAIVAGTKSERLTIENNNLDVAGVNALGGTGISISNVNRASIRNNKIGNFDRNSNGLKSGISVLGEVTNTSIADNSISGLGLVGSAGSVNVTGMFLASSSLVNSNLVIEANEISDISNGTTAQATGIRIVSDISGVIIKSNKISNIRNTHPRGYGAAGILVGPFGGTNYKIQNNFIWDITGSGFAGNTSNDNGHGIVVDNNCNIDIDHNTVLMNSNVSNNVAHKSSCLMISSRVNIAGRINIRGNIFANTQTIGAAGSCLTLFIWNRIVVANMDHNVLYAASQNHLVHSGGIVTGLAGIRTTLGGNANSLLSLPVFVGNNDLHLKAGLNTAIEGKAAPISGLTVDIDGDARDAANPDPGADELVQTTTPQTLQFDVQTGGSTVSAHYGDPEVNGKATASSGLQVGYNSGNTAVATIDANGKIAIIGVGSTVITASQPGDARYAPAPNISFTLLVDTKSVTVTANAKSKTYGDTDPALTYSVSPAMVAGDVLTIDLARDAGEAVGKYAIRQRNMSAGNNYSLTYVSDDLTVLKKTLVVTANDQSREYGAANPALTFSYSGFAFSDDANSLASRPGASTTAVQNSVPGNYPINISGGGAANYDFSFVPGILTIQPVGIQITQLAASSSACANEQVVFSFSTRTAPANVPLAYQWQFSRDGRNFSDIPGEASTVLRYKPRESGSLRCKITLPGAESFFQPPSLSVNAQPDIKIVKQVDNQDCRNPVVKLSASGAVSYGWVPVTGLDNAGVSNPVANPKTTTTYTVTGEDANGCKNMAKVEVIVSPIEYNVPNAFTPDHDGKNDCWGIRHWRDVSEINVTVMNRWGNQVFQSSDATKCWDGTVKGMPQPAGSYVYYIRAVSSCGIIERKGSIILIR